MRCSTPGCPKQAVHHHHLVPRQVIKREVRDKIRARQVLTHPANLVPLCFDCHLGHENWAPRMTRDRIPRHTWDWARALGTWAVIRLEQDYPVRGSDAVDAA